MGSGGSDPTSQQLNSYISQVIVQIKNLIASAPQHIQAQVAQPFHNRWDFWNNSQVPGIWLTGHDFLLLMEELQLNLEGGLSKPGQQQQSVQLVNDEALQRQHFQQQQQIQQQQHQQQITGTGGGGMRSAAQQEKRRQAGLDTTAAEFVPGEKTLVQDLSKRVVKTVRDHAPLLSDAAKRLPTYQKKDWILGAIRANRVVVISGDTG